MMASSINPRRRLGIHYYPDTIHYRQSDLKAWLPELQSMDVAWLTLLAPRDRAIPEDFITGLVQAGIQPVLHFVFSIDPGISTDEFSDLIQTYASWGVRHAVFFEKPNTRASWRFTAWAQTDLVERFLDIWIPLAEALLQAGIRPVLPALEPGGDYWDTAFLRGVLQNLLKRGKGELLNALILGVYAAAGDKALGWGMGGPERWAGARPYYTPPEEQDQRGFCAYDWVRAVSQAVLGRALPMMLFGAGSPGALLIGNAAPAVVSDRAFHEERNAALVRLVQDQPSEPFKTPLADDILAVNFWLLSCEAGHAESDQAWFRDGGETAPQVNMLRLEAARPASPTLAGSAPAESAAPMSAASSVAGNAGAVFAAQKGLAPSAQPVEQVRPGLPPVQARPGFTGGRHPIAHYLLLPTNQAGSLDLQLEGIYPFIKRHNITVGFSLEEARLAAQVTVLETERRVSQTSLDQLRSAGCKVVCIHGNGIELASFLTAL